MRIIQIQPYLLYFSGCVRYLLEHIHISLLDLDTNIIYLHHTNYNNFVVL